MTLLKQVKKDIFKQFGWVIFYEVVATVVLMAVILLLMSFSLAINKSKTLNKYIDRNVIYLTEKIVQMEKDDSTNYGYASSKITDFLQNTLSISGKAGSYVTFSKSAASVDDYDYVILLFGQYVDLCGFETENGIAAYVSYSRKDQVGNVINIQDTDLTIKGAAPKDLTIFHPLNIIGPENKMLDNTLFICFNDYSQAISMYGTGQLAYSVLGRYILIDPDTDDIHEFQKVMYSNTGLIYTAASVEDYIRKTSDPELQKGQLFITFYILTGLILAAIMVLNIFRMINANIHEYVIHHIYGAPILLVKQRVALFVLFLHILPLIGALYVLYVNSYMSWYIFPLLIVAIAGLCYMAAFYAGKKISTLRGLDILRRDY